MKFLLGLLIIGIIGLIGGRVLSQAGYFDPATWGRQAAIRAGEVPFGGPGEFEWCKSQPKGAETRLGNGRMLKCE
ncbi:MAG: hypothetical protein JWO43_177 [Candidatus Adlerbacteria bacterium]|nr:hypothetical protein [Candidatus Adlerbacteria bacterium]